MAPQRDENLKQKVQHIILQKFTNFHAIRSWNFRIFAMRWWPRFLRHPVYIRNYTEPNPGMFRLYSFLLAGSRAIWWWCFRLMWTRISEIAKRHLKRGICGNIKYCIITTEERVYKTNVYVRVCVFLLLKFMENGELLNPECWIYLNTFCVKSELDLHQWRLTYIYIYIYVYSPRIKVEQIKEWYRQVDR